MPKIERFEEIDAWKKARELTRLIYKITTTGQFARDFGLKDQIRRAAVSVMSNIAEGFERAGDKEFRQFLSLSKGSCGELKAQLYIALDADYLTKEEFSKLYDMTNDVTYLIGGFMRYLAESDYRGAKFK